jgi:hypothetical protein
LLRPRSEGQKKDRIVVQKPLNHRGKPGGGKGKFFAGASGSGDESTVNVQGCSGDESGFRAGQERDRGSNFFWLPVTP